MWIKSVSDLSVLVFIKYQLTPGRVSGYFMEIKTGKNDMLFAA